MNNDFLQSIGKIWTPEDLPPHIAEPEILTNFADSICGFYNQDSPKSILLAGDRGVGKSTMVSLVAQRLQEQGWLIFVATAGNLMAGQRYIGDLEQNIQALVKTLSNHEKSLWIVPKFQELYYAGRHEHSPVSILDQILPIIEGGELKVLGELDTSSLERVVQFKPQVLNAFEILRVNSPSKEHTLHLAQGWIDSDDKMSNQWKDFSNEDLNEIYALTSQYLSHRENPGRMMDLLKQTKTLVSSRQEESSQVQFADFVLALSHITGLPTSILDDQQKLDLDELRTFFSKRLLGQDHAVETVIERLAMLKAGLTDPTKPAGIFLFVGPTGTGKTQIAKSLAGYLFGSEDRLVRLDMSEFQTPESLMRILGGPSDVSENSSLVNVIRRRPFSIILLDEVEKAHPSIWDLFLQVFDDGRLTDGTGNTVDFRHSIIILTSNLGVALPASNPIGFNREPNVDEIDDQVIGAIEQTFRPEFVNRIDRIVVFNPLTKSMAKHILKNELEQVLTRRGLRRRGWELDFEESALDFLLDRGFSPTLGARPLKRAVEKYLLAPLAITIVNHDFPKGNQFLLVGASKQQLNVEYIDPDEPNVTWNQKQQIVEDQEARVADLTLRAILLDPKGQLSEFRLIKREIEALQSQVEDQGLVARKEELLQYMSNQDFWSDPARYEMLTEIEYLDRFVGMHETAKKLFDRLHNPEKERVSYDLNLIRKLSQRVYLLDRSLQSYVGGVPQDAFLSIQYAEEDREDAETMQKMYKQWARARGMKIKSIKQKEAQEIGGALLMVTGFAAYPILKDEMGHHIFERGAKENTKKSKVRVVVLPVEIDDYRDEQHSEILARLEAVRNVKNVRRYKFSKSPLVKDLRNSWQTGRLDKVLEGAFDLFQ
ncbi:MAG: AAA family ATPase [Bacteroidota bacterium]